MFDDIYHRKLVMINGCYRLILLQLVDLSTTWLYVNIPSHIMVVREFCEAST